MKESLQTQKYRACDVYAVKHCITPDTGVHAGHIHSNSRSDHRPGKRASVANNLIISFASIYSVAYLGGMSKHDKCQNFGF